VFDISCSFLGIPRNAATLLVTPRSAATLLVIPRSEATFLVIPRSEATFLVIPRSEATRDLLFIAVFKSRSLASLGMTGRVASPG
jgi:hypothetical protein